MANHTGITHIAFEVQNVEQTFNDAINNGAKSLGKVTKRKIVGVGELTFVYFRDPEENIVEIQSWKK